MKAVRRHRHANGAAHEIVARDAAEHRWLALGGLDVDDGDGVGGVARHERSRAVGGERHGEGDVHEGRVVQAAFHAGAGGRGNVHHREGVQRQARHEPGVGGVVQ